MDATTRPRESYARSWWYKPELFLLIMLVLGIYFIRITKLPVRGEETRWARGAAQMVETGDWVVPRQQGQPFLDRPPLASWLMAAVGLVRGQVDLVAIRFPSVLALLFTSLLIYGFARTFLSRTAAFAAGAMYVTMGQVMQIGRLGENEAVYTLLVAGSMLAWHFGYHRGWPRATVWMLGYSLAAVAALQKGIQAPAYFGAAVVLFLILRRDWRCLFSWSHLAGIAAFAGVISFWLVPFYLATDWHSAIIVWSQTVSYRFAHRFSYVKLVKHVTTFPFELLACMLPWSPLLLCLAHRSARRAMGKLPDQVVFVLAAMAATFPSVWLASEGKTRYCIPLYPCMALFLAFLVERIVTCVSAEARGHWTRYLAFCSLAVAVGGGFVFGVSIFPVDSFAEIKQSVPFAFAFAAIAAAVCGVMLWAAKRSDLPSAQHAMFAFAAFLGLSYTGVVINSAYRGSNDMTSAVNSVKERVPAPEKMISLGAISHRFAWYWGMSIEQVEWPLAADDVPEGVSYFCYNQRPGDTDQQRTCGRYFAWKTTPGTLPFEWEKMAEIPVGPRINNDPQEKVIVGKIINRNARTAEKPSDKSGQR